MKQSIFISGKISGLKKEQYKEKFQKSEQLCKALGLHPINPVTLIENKLQKLLEEKPQHMTHEQWQKLIHQKSMELCFQELSKTETTAILLQQDWINSTGSRAEAYTAKVMGKTILIQNEKGASIDDGSIDFSLQINPTI